MHKTNKKIGLLQKTSRIFILLSLLLMCSSSVVLYFYVRKILQKEIEEELYAITARIENSLLKGNLPYIMPPVVEVSEASKVVPEILKDTLIYDDTQQDMELFRELSSFKQIGNKVYKVTVRDYVLESQNILLAIVLSYVLIIALVLILLFYLNRAGNAYLWNPFFHTLAQIEKFSLTGKESIALENPDILEFTQLNDKIRDLTRKVRDDYHNLKQFTEDVSHELQTPLSIIQMKVDHVINAAPVSEEQYQQLTSIQKDIKRLTQMNKGLTLLTKIENSQFAAIREIDFNTMIQGKITDFEELFGDKIYIDSTRDLIVEMNDYLAEILCNNLISNAIKYCSKKGEITIGISSYAFTVKNTGNAPIVHSEQVFNRFYRENSSAKSTGLGLAIVKKICDLYGFKISYAFSDGMHVFTVDFSGN
ncbi:sensor histidine kinase [Sinomicrobium sp. M5D2P17]